MRKYNNIQRVHDWNHEDETIAYYCEKFGTDGLTIKDETELAQSVIGASKASLAMKKANFKHLINGEGFEHYSVTQLEVIEKYSKLSKDELKVVVNKIISTKDLSANKKEFNKRSKDKKNEKELIEIFKKMGKDPKKMKKVI